MRSLDFFFAIDLILPPALRPRGRLSLQQKWLPGTFFFIGTKKTETKLHDLSPRANYTDRVTAACWRSDCQLLRIKGATWSAWRIPTAVFSVFLTGAATLLSSSSSVVLMRLSGPRSRPTNFFSGSAGNQTRASGSVAKNSDHLTTEAVFIGTTNFIFTWTFWLSQQFSVSDVSLLECLVLAFLQSWVCGPASNPGNLEGPGVSRWCLFT
jgi:hypothetical protein